jgi:AcrR family transcriptional regulator
MGEVHNLKRPRRPKGRPKANEAAVGAEELVRATCDLMRTVPPAAITWAAVARHAGVNPSLYQYYFKTRPRLLAAAARAMIRKVEDRVVSALASAGDGFEVRLRCLVLTLMGFYREYPFIFALVQQTDQDEEGVIYGDTVKTIRQFEAFLGLGSDEGLRQTDSAFLTALIIGASAFVATNPRVIRWGKGAAYHEDRLDEEFADFFCDLVRKGLETR